MPISKDYLKEQAAALGFSLTETMLDQFAIYADFLVEYNEKVNLTAITDPQGIVVKHFLDSLLLVQAAALPQGASLVDVGTGAGFPSIPVKIYRPDLRITLLDSLQKRISFLQELCRRLSIEGECCHARAEDAGRQAGYRERFDAATARAVANLRELAEYCLPLVKTGGMFLALKGYDVEEELSGAGKAIAVLGGEIQRIEKFLLPGDNRRAIVVIKKISQTPPKYPRMPAKIAKNPLI